MLSRERLSQQKFYLYYGGTMLIALLFFIIPEEWVNFRFETRAPDLNINYLEFEDGEIPTPTPSPLPTLPPMPSPTPTPDPQYTPTPTPSPSPTPPPTPTPTPPPTPTPIPITIDLTLDEPTPMPKKEKEKPDKERVRDNPNENVNIDEPDLDIKLPKKKDRSKDMRVERERPQNVTIANIDDPPPDINIASDRPQKNKKRDRYVQRQKSLDISGLAGGGDEGIKGPSAKGGPRGGGGGGGGRDRAGTGGGGDIDINVGGGGGGGATDLADLAKASGGGAEFPKYLKALTSLKRVNPSFSGGRVCNCTRPSGCRSVTFGNPIRVEFDAGFTLMVAPRGNTFRILLTQQPGARLPTTSPSGLANLAVEAIRSCS